ncbi:MAG: acyl-CoA synthetase [Antricoccus sp.]
MTYPGAWSATKPDGLAAVDIETGKSVTFKELDDRSMQLAQWLTKQGLGYGDCVATLASNSVECFEIYWAAMRCGLYLTPINFHLLPAEVSYILNDCGAKALVISADLADSAEAALADAPNIVAKLAFGGTVPGFDDYDEKLAAQPAEQPAEHRAGRTMLYSSGTTGRPKGVLFELPGVPIEEDNDGSLGDLTKLLFGFGEDTKYLSPAPLYHAAPLRYSGRVQALGGTVHFLKKFDAQQALEAIEKYQITHSQWVPTMFVRMLKLPDEVRLSYDVSSLQVAIHAAAPCPREVKAAMIDWWGPIIWEYYAGSESNGATFISSEQWLQKPGSVGKPAVGSIHVCDELGEELEPFKIGKVYFEQEGPGFEYYHDDDKTKASRHPAHADWSAIGDLGYIDEDGFLFLAERQSFVIISGGVNIYPQEIEDVVTMHPAVFDVAVIGVPHPDFGEEVKAVIQLVDGVPATDETKEELMAFLAQNLAKFKLPRSIDFIEQLPRTPTGKLRKHEIRKLYDAPIQAAEPGVQGPS